jgi:hypothetical protein
VKADCDGNFLLRDIAAQNLPPDAAAWRSWYQSTGH